MKTIKELIFKYLNYSSRTDWRINIAMGNSLELDWGCLLGIPQPAFLPAHGRVNKMPNHF